MKVKFSVTDRLMLQQLLPANGGLIEMTTVKSLIECIAITPEEIELFELKDQPGNVITFNQAKAKDIEVDVSAAALSILKAIPAKIDSEKRVTIAMIPLLEKLQAL